jgi:hypothetical protein
MKGQLAFEREKAKSPQRKILLVVVELLFAVLSQEGIGLVDSNFSLNGERMNNL